MGLGSCHEYYYLLHRQEIAVKLTIWWTYEGRPKASELIGTLATILTYLLITYLLCTVIKTNRYFCECLHVRMHKMQRHRFIIWPVILLLLLIP